MLEAEAQKDLNIQRFSTPYDKNKKVPLNMMDCEVLIEEGELLMGIIDKMSSPHVIANYADLMDALGGTFQTNMSAEEIQSIVQFQMDQMPSWKIEQYMVDGSGARLMCASLGQEAYVMVPDQQTVKVAKEKISAVMDGESSDSVDVEK